ncbi:phosphorylase family protein [Tunturibacter empetritectus]|uniref:Adenosylhomocysteine nucleosidase n=1 Tax=Tunturiibacter lichenicola TaxID=2051959 RepID=A0A7W8JAW3_9BACT|nr:nucleoside phosphorylase [Edaphobacter lichenicola]MBB5345915.1 adenosylhomocysteine nucleosidase [Edaphobacter lichenicola]
MKGNIAIIAALEGELKPLVRGRGAGSWKRRESSKGCSVWEYRHADGCWIAACAGMGEVRAALAFAEAEKIAAIDAVCSVGWAGALDGTIAAESVSGVSLVIDTKTGERFRPTDLQSAWPVLATTTRVADEREKKRLAASYGARLVDMEAATIARIALGKSIQFYCFKAVSDDAEARLPDLNPFVADNGRLKMLPFLAHVAVRPGSWSGLMKLGRHSSAAAKNLAEALYGWLDESGSLRRLNGDYTEKQR